MKVIQEMHQFDDELRPVQPSPAHDWDGAQWVLDPAKAVEVEAPNAERLCAQVDAAADSARQAITGDPLRAMEYANAAADARAFKEAGYPPKAVPLSVGAWAVKGRTAEEAANDILDKSAEFNDRVLALRTLRLKAKEKIRAQLAKGKTEQAREVADNAVQAIGKVVSDLVQ